MNDQKQFGMRTLIAVLMFVSVIAVYAEESQTTVHKEGSFTSLGAYEAKDAKTLNDIPETARKQLIEHLKQRLGEAFYSSLEFTGGQIVDFAEFHDVEPMWKNYKWEVFAYNLRFEFRLPSKGIEYYEANIWLRSDGSVIQEINLPEIAKHPDRGVFIPLTRAIQIATVNRFNVSHCRVDMDYRRDEDICVYTFDQLIRHEGVRLFYKTIEVNAHTGAVSKIFNHEAIE